jgi:hypothetical protein
MIRGRVSTDWSAGRIYCFTDAQSRPMSLTAYQISNPV